MLPAELLQMIFIGVEASYGESIFAPDFGVLARMTCVAHA